MNELKVALFPDNASRDKAFEALKGTLLISMVGNANLVAGATRNQESTPFISFVARSPMDMLTFMQKGAMSCC